jgi:hypothetical protein
MAKGEQRQDLIRCLREATGGSGELNARILCATIAPDGAQVRQSRISGAWCVYFGSDARSRRPRMWLPSVPIPTPSGSIDDAIVLVGEALPGCQVHVSISTGSRLRANASLAVTTAAACAHLTRPEEDEAGLGYVIHTSLQTAASAPLAIMLALLEALSRLDKTDPMTTDLSF